MVWKQMGSAIAVSLVGFTNIIYADTTTNNSAQMRNLENRMTALEQRKNGCGMINPPGRPQIRCGADLFVFGDLIYWNTHENGLNYAIVNKGDSTNLANAEVKNIHGKWNWGFRLGAGYNLPYDGWDLRFTWLRFTDNAKKHANPGDDGFVFPTMTAAADPTAQDSPCLRANAHWRMRLDQLDLDLGREFFVSKHLTLRPHGGLRTYWLKQKLEVEYNNFTSFGLPNEVEVESKDRWWGIGLETGLDTQWNLGAGVSLFGNIAAAIVYGFHHLKFEDEDTPARSNGNNNSSSLPNGVFADVRNRYRVSQPVLDILGGVRWDNMFTDDRFHLGIQLAWEHHIYFDQNQLMVFTDDFNFGKFFANQGNLTLQGWTFSMRFDF